MEGGKVRGMMYLKYNLKNKQQQNHHLLFQHSECLEPHNQWSSEIVQRIGTLRKAVMILTITLRI